MQASDRRVFENVKGLFFPELAVLRGPCKPFAGALRAAFVSLGT
jgi:hypothetical protein